MAETQNPNPNQIQTQIPLMEKVNEEESKQIIDIIYQKLEFAINPKFHELKVFPYKFMVVPSLQRFGMATYKFKKIETKYSIAYFDGESLIIYNNDTIELYIKSRSSRKIYHKIFYEENEVPYVLIPRLSDLTTEKAEFMGFENNEDLARELFSLKLTLDSANVYHQGHLYALRIYSVSNIDLWLRKNEYKMTDKSDEIYGHKLKDNFAYAITDEIYYLDTGTETIVEHLEHGTHVLPQGKWLLYHPRPRNNRVD